MSRLPESTVGAEVGPSGNSGNPGNLARPDWLRPAFDRWSTFYDNPAVQAAVYRPVHSQVLRDLHGDGARRILDVGCGTGILASRIQQENGSEVEIFGCDWSAGMLEQAIARNPRVGWLQADAADLPFRDAAFDAVITTEAFHWFPDQGAALREFKRVLRPDGTVHIALINPSTRLGARLLEAGSRAMGGVADWPTRGDMRRRVQTAGFRVRQQRRTPRAFRMVVPTVLTSAVKVV
ncbi:MAG TPA: class I SAM-dependent methyltransferase [Acidimicrobiales bacterium]